MICSMCKTNHYFSGVNLANRYEREKCLLLNVWSEMETVFSGLR